MYTILEVLSPILLAVDEQTCLLPKVGHISPRPGSALRRSILVLGIPPSPPPIPWNIYHRISHITIHSSDKKPERAQIRESLVFYVATVVFVVSCPGVPPTSYKVRLAFHAQALALYTRLAFYRHLTLAPFCPAPEESPRGH